MDAAKLVWKTANPSPRRVQEGMTNRAETPEEYEAAATFGAQVAMDQAARKLAGQQEIEDLGFTVAQAKAVHAQLKTGSASAVNAQKTLAAVLRYLWREMLEP